MILEKNLQAKLIKLLKQSGFFVRKISGENSKGLPDILIAGYGVVQFVEVKTPTGRLSKLQSHTIGEMQDAGAKVEVWNSVEQCTDFIRRTRGSS